MYPTVAYMQILIICKYYAILYKGPEFMEGSGTNPLQILRDNCNHFKLLLASFSLFFLLFKKIGLFLCKYNYYIQSIYNEP